MVNITNFPCHHQNMSWRQVWNFHTISTQVLSSGSIDDPSFQQRVKNWCTTANRINASIKESRPFFKWIIDFVTLRLLKKWVLSRILLRELKKIDVKAYEIACHLWHTLPAPDPLETVLKAENYFQENRHRLLNLVPNPAQSSLAGRVAQVPAHIHPETIEAQIKDYFQRKLEAIQAHQTVALPAWYHATSQGENAIDIISSGTLKAHNAAAGHGVYFSTRHERSYGEYCFAVDHRVIEDLPAHYFPHHLGFFRPHTTVPTHYHAVALWVQVEADVPIRWSSVAHIIVSTEQASQKLHRQLSQKAHALPEAALAALTCPIVYGTTSEILQECFMHASAKLTLPPSPFWTRHAWWFKNLPNQSISTLPVQETAALLLA